MSDVNCWAPDHPVKNIGRNYYAHLEHFDCSRCHAFVQFNFYPNGSGHKNYRNYQRPASL